MSQKTYIPPRPVGDSNKMLFHQAVWDVLWGGKFPFITTNKTRWSFAPGRGFTLDINPAGRPGASGWHPRNGLYEVDNTDGYEIDHVIHIQSTHTLVITGMVDLVSGVNVKATAGMYVARQAVPAKVTVSGVDKWNVPQNPMPVPGDYDDEDNFWIPIGGGGGTECPYET